MAEWKGLTAMRERFALLNEESTVNGSCECGLFVFEGALRDERAAFREHVVLCHPERLAALDARRKSQPMAKPSPEPEFALLSRLDALRKAA